MALMLEEMLIAGPSLLGPVPPELRGERSDIDVDAGTGTGGKLSLSNTP